MIEFSAIGVIGVNLVYINKVNTLENHILISKKRCNPL